MRLLPCTNQPVDAIKTTGGAFDAPLVLLQHQDTSSFYNDPPVALEDFTPADLEGKWFKVTRGWALVGRARDLE